LFLVVQKRFPFAMRNENEQKPTNFGSFALYFKDNKEDGVNLTLHIDLYLPLFELLRRKM